MYNYVQEGEVENFFQHKCIDMAETETDTLRGLFSFENSHNYLSDLSPPAKFYLPLCNINTWTTQAINIMQSLMKSS